jgi:hypothetical protein
MLHAFALLALAGFQEPAPPHPFDLDQAARAFAQVKELSDRDAGKLWGRHLNGPILFVDARTLWAIASQADQEGHLRPQGALWLGRLPDRIAPANTALDWAGVRWTMVLWPLPDLPHARGRLLLHECFHRIQNDLGLPASNPANAHLDEESGRVWMRLEMRALAEALSQDGKARDQAIRDALAFRERRHALCGAPSAEGERQLELNEGLAEYTGIVLSGFGRPSWAARAAVRLEQEQASPTIARSFAYATGPAYGLLLDLKRPGWRKSLHAESSLAFLLAQAMRTSGTETPESRAGRYGGADLIASERRQAEARQRKVEGFRAKFVEGPTLVLPVESEFAYSYNPNAVSSFPGFGQVFETAKISDEWGVLQVHSGGVLLLRNESRVTGVVVAPPKTVRGQSLEGEGWTLELSPNWKTVAGERPGSSKVVRAP